MVKIVLQKWLLIESGFYAALFFVLGLLMWKDILKASGLAAIILGIGCISSLIGGTLQIEDGC